MTPPAPKPSVRVIEELRGLIEAAKFGPLTCDNYFPSEIFEQTPKGPAKAIEIRGWGWLQKQEDGEQVRDARGRLVHAAMTRLPALIAIAEAASERQAFAATFTCVAEAGGVGHPRHQAWDRLEALDNKLNASLSALDATGGGL